MSGTVATLATLGSIGVALPVLAWPGPGSAAERPGLRALLRSLRLGLVVVRLRRAAQRGEPGELDLRHVGAERPLRRGLRGRSARSALLRDILPGLHRRGLGLLRRLPVRVLGGAVLGELARAVLPRRVALSVRVGVLLVGTRAEAPGRENGDGNKSR